MRLFKYIFFLLLFIAGSSNAQTSWEDKVSDFEDSLKRYSSYSGSELNTLLLRCAVFIDTYDGIGTKEAMSDLFIIKAETKNQILTKKLSGDADSLFLAQNAQLIGEIEADYRQAIAVNEGCKCSALEEIKDFYYNYGTKKKYEQVEKEARANGVVLDYNFIGIDINYASPKNIISAEVGILGTWSLRQPKTGIKPDGTKYRKCGYEYPMALGILFLGYETSFTNTNYRAAKLNLFWFKYYMSVHPLQLLYATEGSTRSFIYRPEAGFSFSTFAVDYALNLPLNGGFKFLPRNNLSIRICIPAISVFKKK